jgi:hypothetical protein
MSNTFVSKYLHLRIKIITLTRFNTNLDLSSECPFWAFFIKMHHLAPPNLSDITALKIN